MDIMLFGILLGAGFVGGLVVGGLIDRNDLLYYCQRSKRRDEETVEKFREQVNALLDEASSEVEPPTEYCQQCETDQPFYRRVMKDGLYIKCNVCHWEISYDPIDFD